MKSRFLFAILIVLSGFKMHAIAAPGIKVTNSSTTYDFEIHLFALEDGDMSSTCGYPTSTITLYAHTPPALPDAHYFADINAVCSDGYSWLAGYGCHSSLSTPGSWLMAVVNRTSGGLAVAVGVSGCASGTTASVPGCGPTTSVSWSYISMTDTYIVTISD